jgi:hypothetical protein
VVEEIAAQRKKLIRSGKTSARRPGSVTAHRAFQSVFVQDELETPCEHGGDLRRPIPGDHLLNFVVLEDGEVYVKVSLEQCTPFEAGPRSLTLDERKPGCADVLQPSGVPKVAVRVSSDEREVQIRESIGGRIRPSPRAENYGRAEVLLSLRPDEETFDDALVCQRRLVYGLSFTSPSAKASGRRAFAPVGGRLDNVLPMRLIVLQFRSFWGDQ